MDCPIIIGTQGVHKGDVAGGISDGLQHVLDFPVGGRAVLTRIDKGGKEININEMGRQGDNVF